MKKLKNIKHIFAIIILSLTFLFVGIFLSSDENMSSLNGLFIYRTGNGTWQDTIHKHNLKPSDDIVIIKIDEKTINTIQSSGSDLKMLTIPKSVYIDLIEKLEFVDVK